MIYLEVIDNLTLDSLDIWHNLRRDMRSIIQIVVQADVEHLRSTRHIFNPAWGQSQIALVFKWKREGGGLVEGVRGACWSPPLCVGCVILGHYISRGIPVSLGVIKRAVRSQSDPN